MALKDPSPTATPIFRPALYPSFLYLLGMLAIFLGERVLDVGGMQTVFTLAGVLMLLGAIAARAVRQAVRPLAFRMPERALLLLYVVGAFAVLLYFLNSDLMVRLSGRALEQSMPRFSGVLSALWPALWLAGSLPVLFVELSLFSMSRAPIIETGRVRSAMLSGLGIALAVVFCFSLTYVATERDGRVDFSYFRTARPGESTKKIVRALDKPVNVHLFFPPANEVREEVESYFAELSRESKQLSLQRWDQAIHPAKARELGVAANGVIVVARDTLREQLGIALELDRARANLRSLDADFQKRLLQVTRKAKVAYFTAGHDERTDAPSAHNEQDNERRASVRALRTQLVDQGFEPRELGLAQGLGTEVPADASVVLVIGPAKPFSAEEIGALQRYIDKNGRLLLALDPEAGQTFPELLSNLWLEYHPTPLAHESYHLPLTRQASDRVNLGAATWSSHASVTTNSRGGVRAPLLMLGAGYLSKKEKTGTGIINVDVTLRSEGKTFADKNGDFTFNEGQEMRAAYDLVAAVTKRNASAVAPEEEARVVVTTDSDLFTDRALRLNPGNRAFVLDVFRWLGGEERFSGQVSSEEDMPVSHTKKEDLIWFYLSIFAMPAAVLGFGFVMTRRRKRRGSSTKAGPPVRTGPGTPPADKPTNPPTAGTPPTSEVNP
jgi:hypothetical protein